MAFNGNVNFRLENGVIWHGVLVQYYFLELENRVKFFQTLDSKERYNQLVSSRRAEDWMSTNNVVASVGRFTKLCQFVSNLPERANGPIITTVTRRVALWRRGLFHAAAPGPADLTP